MSSIPSQLRATIVMFGVLSAVCGLLYPAIVSGIGHAAFPHQADGSIVQANGRPAGSSLIGQPFSAPGYFWGRPSATAPMPYNAAGSGGSNLGPSNPALADAVKERVAALRQADPDNRAPVPVDLVTASGSGLDPEISLAAAYYQAARVARARRLPLEAVRTLVAAHGEERMFGLFGEARVNVLALNLALDGVSQSKGRTDDPAR